MSSGIFERGLLTNQLLTQLATAGKPVGDAVKPVTGGWQGAAGTSDFVPYVVLSPLVSSVSFGPIGDPQADMQVPYALDSLGIDREQTEWMADRARRALDALTGQTLDLGIAYDIQQIWGTSMGATVPVFGTDPPYFGQSDVITVWLSKH